MKNESGFSLAIASQPFAPKVSNCCHCCHLSMKQNICVSSSESALAPRPSGYTILLANKLGKLSKLGSRELLLRWLLLEGLEVLLLLEVLLRLEILLLLEVLLWFEILL